MYRPGDPLAICDFCGFRFHRSELRKTWQGLLACSKDWEPQHPQEKIRPVVERNTVIDARPEGTDVFLEPGDVTAEDL